MNTFPRFISKQIGKLIPTDSLFNISTPVFQPFYHVVSNKTLPFILNYPYRNSLDFEQELDFFLKYFKPVSLEELYTKSFKNEKVFHLSFDDGLKECAEIIAPVLIKKGVPASFFVNSAFVDNKALFHRYKASLILSELKKKTNTKAEKYLNDKQLNQNNLLQTSILKANLLDTTAEILGLNFADFLQEQQPYLTVEQLLILQGQGFSIGAHSNRHAEFYSISEEEQFKEVSSSMKWLNKHIQPKIKAFSFPFTDSGVAANFLNDLKMQGICDITFGTAGLKFDELDFHFQRYPMEQEGNFIQNLKSEWVYFKLRQLIGKATVKH